MDRKWIENVVINVVRNLVGELGYLTSVAYYLNILSLFYIEFLF